MLALFDSDNKVNAIQLTFAKILELFIRLTDVKVQKIDGTMLDIYEIVVTNFLVTDKANQLRLFEKTFWIANVSLEIVYGMLFLNLSSANIDFLDQKLQWRSYTTQKAFLTTRRVKLIVKKEFATIAFDPKYETFVI